MITEDYVSLEVAKLLKEKGFSLPSTNFKDWLCCMYDENGDIQWGCYHPNWYARITLQMAMKWLREVHGLNVQPCIVRTIELKKAYNATIYDNNCEQIKSHFGSNIFDGFKSYEEACEAAIEYCLTNLIK